jgi:hypothetical protein
MPFKQDLCVNLERFHDKHTNKDCRAYKYLGIYLDEHLSFDQHVKHISNKLNKSMYCMRAAKTNLNLQGLRALYFALIHSHLSYCPSILSCLSNTNKKTLLKVQKKAIRLITKSKYNAHTAPLFLELKILPFDKIIKQGKLIFMHSINFQYAPKAFTNIWTKNGSRQGDLNQNLNLNLRNDNLFKIPAPRIELFKRMTLYSLPLEWNSSGNLMFYENQLTFKLALREQLFEEIANEINIEH